MPEKTSLIPSGVGSLEETAIDALGLRDAVDGALAKARQSGLPGVTQGPADACRHILISAEMT